ncbi:MAG: Ig-like domain-containing protein, partial [Candidatus Hadarchaeales archaeon]
PTSGTTDDSGKVTVTYTAPTVTVTQTVTITASFAGDNQYAGSENSSTGTISPVVALPTLLKLEPSSFIVGSGKNITLVATLLDRNGNPLAGRILRWSATQGSLPGETVTNAKGEASAVYTAPQVEVSTSVEVSVVFPGDNSYAASSASSSGLVLAPETEVRLKRLENSAETIGVPMAKENLYLLANALAEGRLGASIDVKLEEGVPAGRVSFAERNVRVRVRRVEVGEIEVGVDSDRGRTIVVNVAEGILSRVPKVLVDNVEIGPADNYQDVLDPANDGENCEYLILLGGRGMQILISIPRFSTRTITIRGPIAAKPSIAPLLIAVVIVVVAVILLVTFRRPKRRGKSR